jgi:hypothetical protein
MTFDDRLRTESMRAALAEAGREVPALAAVKRNTPLRFTLPAPDVTDHAIALLDVTATESGWALIEQNGSNGAFTSIIDDDRSRASHMADVTVAGRRAEEGTVALLGHQHGFHFIDEFHNRAFRYAAAVVERTGLDVAIRRFDEEPIDHGLTVVVGPLPDIAPLMTVAGGALRFAGRDVAFMSNPNLLPELVRRDVLAQRGSTLRTPIHDGVLVDLVHDKTAQQHVAVAAGFDDLRAADATTPKEARALVHDIHRGGQPAVLKMNAGSGGTGIEIVGPGTDVDEVLRRLTAGAVEKYGTRAVDTMWPLRISGFATSLPILENDGPRQWDLRVQVLARPGEVEVSPCIVRLCPAPYHGALDRDSVVSNLSGRPASVDHLRPAEAAGAVRPLAELGERCAAWMRTALATERSAAASLRRKA